MNNPIHPLKEGQRLGINQLSGNAYLLDGSAMSKKLLDVRIKLENACAGATRGLDGWRKNDPRDK